MRLQLETFTDALELKVDFDRIVCARADGYAFATENRNCGEISGTGGIDDDAINAVFGQGLAPQIKKRAVKIE